VLESQALFTVYRDENTVLFFLPAYHLESAGRLAEAEKHCSCCFDLNPEHHHIQMQLGLIKLVLILFKNVCMLTHIVTLAYTFESRNEANGYKLSRNNNSMHVALLL